MAQRSILKEYDLTEVENVRHEKLADLQVPSLTEAIIPLKDVGSSNSRSKEQSVRARNIILQDLRHVERTDIIAFTDGSALGNPGACGAGATLYVGSLESNPIDSSPQFKNIAQASVANSMQYC